MQELKKQTMEIINNINQAWVTEAKKSQYEKRVIDIKPVFSVVSEQLTNLDALFDQAKVRLGKEKPSVKKGIIERIRGN